MSLGDRDFKQIIRNAIKSVGEDLDTKIDSGDANSIHAIETVRCLRRAYFNRTDPLSETNVNFNNLVSGMFRKLEYGSELKSFEIEKIRLMAQADMVSEDVVFIFRSVDSAPETPLASDVLYLNACMWIFDKMDGLIVYITGDGKEESFVLNRDKKMFEEVIRRVRVLNDLLTEKKTPILEPSADCGTCQYFERCFMKKKETKTIQIQELFGFKKQKE